MPPFIGRGCRGEETTKKPDFAPAPGIPVAVNHRADYIAATRKLPQVTGVEDAVRVVAGPAKADESLIEKVLNRSTSLPAEAPK